MPDYRTFARSVHSQYGEDGIIEALLERIPDRNLWCVEFGAWDGVHLSNCADLIESHGYSAAMIEASAERFQDLQRTYDGNDRVIPIRGFVGWGSSDNLSAILGAHGLPSDPDVLSIDIDGNDYHVWEAACCQAKIVCVEFNPTIANPVEFVQPKDPSVKQGSSVASLVKLGKEKGYELVACTETNALFVDAGYFPLLDVEDNTLAVLRPDQIFATYAFVGYDGTVLLDGYKHLLWHRMDISTRRIQQLPRFLRVYPDDYSAFQRLAFRVFRRLRRPRG